VRSTGAHRATHPCGASGVSGSGPGSGNADARCAPAPTVRRWRTLRQSHVPFLSFRSPSVLLLPGLGVMREKTEDIAGFRVGPISILPLPRPARAAGRPPPLRSNASWAVRPGRAAPCPARRRSRTRTPPATSRRSSRRHAPRTSQALAGGPRFDGLKQEVVYLHVALSRTGLLRRRFFLDRHRRHH